MTSHRTSALWSPHNTPLGRAVADMREGLMRFELWGVLGWQDIRQRYRRSIIGPFWLTISTAIMVGAMGFLYARIFGQEVSTYLPFLAVGLVMWGTISTMVNESCTAFTIVEQIIKQIRLPLTTHVCRMVWRNVIVFAHNAVVLAAVSLWFGDLTLLRLVAALAGICLLFISGVWAGLVIAIVCTRYRDVPPIIASVMQIAFFVTPILWQPSLLGGRTWMTDWNPLFHLIEIVRAPLLGNPFPAHSFVFVCAMTAGGFVCALAMLTRYRSRVPYWL